MPRLVEEATGIGVNEHQRGFVNGLLNGLADGRLRLVWMYIFMMTLYDT